MFSVAFLCMATSCAGPDDGVPLRFHPDRVFEAIPSSMLMNVEHMGEARPAWITKEPAYKETPWYATLKIGEPKAGHNPITIVLDEDDAEARVYIDLNANGDLTDDPRPTHTREVIPEEKRTPILKVWIFDVFNAKVPAAYADGSTLDLPITVRTYGKVCRDLNNNMKPDIVYWSTYYRAGTATFGNAQYPVAVKDQNADGRFDTLRSEKAPRGDMVYIDTDRSGTFDPRTEGFSLDRAFEIDGKAYEVTRVSPSGDRITFAPSAKAVAQTAIKVGQIAPDFDIPGVGKLSSLQGKLVLVDFWATWCIPCLAEAPNVIKVADRFKDQGFQVIGVSIDKLADAEAMTKLAHDKGMTWPEVHDHAQTVARQYFVTAIPATFLIGPDGRVLATHLRGDDLMREVDRVIGSARKDAATPKPVPSR